MRPDRPVIGAVVCLATGIALIVAWCHDASSASLAYPLAGSNLHIDLSTSGPAVLGGLFFLALGVLFLLWSLLAAIVSQISLLIGSEDRMESIVGKYREPSFEYDNYPNTITLTESKKEG
jgi:hypothetical protein